MLKRLDRFEDRHLRRVAVIGSGISGLSAAWLLSYSADVTLFEAEDRPGGHSNTFDIPTAGGPVPVDTGFIVYNEINYPNLTALFQYLDVPTDASDMSFAASLRGGSFEYSGTNLATMLGQRSNIVNLRFWMMLRDIVRFYRNAQQMEHSSLPHELTLGDYLSTQNYSRSFIDDHILPMGAAIWSTTAPEMRNYPLAAFISFFKNHGLVNLGERPAWRTVHGGSREYVTRLLADFDGDVRLGSPVVRVERLPGAVEVQVKGQEPELFDHVVIAAHANQALRMLKGGFDDERRLLGAFGYTKNEAVLHSDPGLMPRRKRVWASWNYVSDSVGEDESQLCVTYWMNRLQQLQTADPVFVTLNPIRAIAEDKVHARFSYEHPLFDRKAMEAQRQMWRVQGRGGLWYCGAHFGSGFHEDGIQAGLAVAEAISGIKRPWRVENESGRIHLEPAMVAAE
ncbi:NAD(P)/FAD-dependent oxidoreductase [Rhizobium sp. L1K21]|uniref:NAD(P)/FAD-dependent oxidoreductase n=1 Tax=Rhizobium sp. L1K21 TaxID=2954933 RepID=UPI0020922D21|nr:FAD-dependent oxidoreductase [Rhizobium sp. L1K21]MCO6185261.1 FAD-dependent oxidoreductase [Rhizobium sp. L1K21]